MTSKCKYRAFCVVYYLDQPINNINIKNECLYRKYSLSVLTDVMHSRLLSFYYFHVRTVHFVLFII